MSKTKFPTIADIACAILSSSPGFEAVWYDPHNHIFIIGERVPIRITHPWDLTFCQKFEKHLRTISFKEGYDIYCKAYSK